MISEDFDKFADETTDEWGYPKSEIPKIKQSNSEEES